MTIAAVTDRTPALMAQLVAVWEGSVREIGRAHV